jgi:type III restriction enzyme
MDDTSSTGDVIAAELREGFERFDFGIPFILREADEESGTHAPWTCQHAARLHGAMTRRSWPACWARATPSSSQDLQSATLFGDYRVDGAVMNVAATTIPGAPDPAHQPGAEPAAAQGQQIATHLAKPYLQVNTAD